MRISVAWLCLLAGCSGGDLTLPESAEPVRLKVLSGDGQRADAGALLEEPLVVQVLGTDSKPIPGVRVEFGFLGEVPGSGVDPALVTTGADGLAEAFVRLGSEDGEQMIIARVAGTASPDLSARFRAVALSSGGGGGGKHDKEDERGGDDDDDDDD